MVMVVVVMVVVGDTTGGQGGGGRGWGLVGVAVVVVGGLVEEAFPFRGMRGRGGGGQVPEPSEIGRAHV